ncbi:MAG: hypothetical protein L3K17_09085 [Thermoplasmata archaeon]|nr:hypothetical protein [Thermoplasmata archaeon]
MTGREPAWRILAQELLASSEREKGKGERATSYLLSPLGARMNRVLVCGTLETAESNGRDGAPSFLRARLTDPTGIVEITAGTFQPRAMDQLAAWKVPAPAIVVGRVHVPRSGDGVVHPSIQAEALRGISPTELRLAFADAVEHTARRIRLIRSLQSSAGRTDAEESTPSPKWVAAARTALERYPSVSPESFLKPLGNVIAFAESLDHPLPRNATSVEVTAPARRGSLSTQPSPTDPSAADRARESAFLDIIDQLADSSSDGCADLREAFQRAAQRGLREATAEELLNRLEESGVVEEPMVGRLRRT